MRINIFWMLLIILITIPLIAFGEGNTSNSSQSDFNDTYMCEKINNLLLNHSLTYEHTANDVVSLKSNIFLDTGVVVSMSAIDSFIISFSENCLNNETIIIEDTQPEDNTQNNSIIITAEQVSENTESPKTDIPLSIGPIPFPQTNLGQLSVMWRGVLSLFLRLEYSSLEGEQSEVMLTGIHVWWIVTLIPLICITIYLIKKKGGLREQIPFRTDMSNHSDE